VGWLDGKVAIVTGAGRMRGIGRAVALRLAQEGADVAVTAVARPTESFPEHEREAGWRGVESVAEEVEALGRRGLPLDLDVTDAAQVRAMVERTEKELGRLDVLVNNAGLALVSGSRSLWEIEDEEWFREVDVNLHGTYHCCKAFAAALVRRDEGGKIINVSSLAGRQGQAQYGGYTPSKFGVVGLTQMLAKELAPHRVNVNCVCPGSTDTDMMDGTFQRTGDRMGLTFEMIKQATKAFIPLGRQAEPSEIASVIAFLASPQADYITGQAINVDGGLMMM
jgi:NAD(P)-dependent dehydrogenase (short-subunit alcohol dehydrogenase family)